MKNNNQTAIHAAYNREYTERDKWTRVWAEEYICDMVRFAATLSPHDPKKAKLIKSIPAACSVKYDWLDSIIADAGAAFPKQLHIPTNCYDKLYDFIVGWLDSADSTLDRQIIIMRACMLPMNEIGARLGISRQRTSRRYASAVQKLVWHLNHSKDYQRPQRRAEK